MKVFISGIQEPDFIWETLDDLNNAYGVTVVCGSAISPCMTHVTEWAEENEIGISLHLPHGLETLDIIKLNTYIIEREKPDLVFLYDETPLVKRSMLDDAQRIDSSVRYVLWKNK